LSEPDAEVDESVAVFFVDGRVFFCGHCGDPFFQGMVR
jgi:hypothetical protein